MSFRFLVHFDGGRASPREARGRTARVGRNPASDLALEDEDLVATVSWDHAQLAVDGNRLYLTDLGSTNGTSLNGQRMAANEPRRVAVGDRIKLGSVGPEIEILGFDAAAGLPRPNDHPVAALPAPFPLGFLPKPDATGIARRNEHNALAPVGPLVPLPMDRAANLPATRSHGPSFTRQLVVMLQERHSRLRGAMAVAVPVALVLVVGISWSLRQLATKTDALGGRQTKTEVTVSELGKLASATQRQADEAITGARQANRAAKSAQEKADETARLAAAADAAARTAQEKAIRMERLLPVDSQEIFNRAVRAVGLVISLKEDGEATGTGTGFLLSRQRRLFITANHVVSDTNRAAVIFPSFDGQNKVIHAVEFYKQHRSELVIPSEVIVHDRDHDVAVLRLNRLPSDPLDLSLAQDDPVSGTRVHTMGNPGVSEGLWVYTQGYVKQTTVKAHLPGVKIVEVTNITNPGDSGGPLITDRAEVVGICSYSHGEARSQPTMNFIAVSEIKKAVTP